MADHYVVLSRKYRPKDLRDMIGQDVLSKSLKSCLDNKKVPHAFLFHGIRGVGKTTTARILARCLSCIGLDGNTDMTSSPCGVCRSCVAMDKDQHMDIMEFDAASRTGVDDIREMIDAAQYVPVLGRYKIFIIDEVHMLSKSAFNALLKTLEEPPGHVKFIFATTEINKIPETILSRCMSFQLKPVSKEALAKHISGIVVKEGLDIEDSAVNIIAEEAEGSVRDALSMLEQAIMLANGAKITQDMLIEMLGGAKTFDTNELLNLIINAKTKDALQKAESIISNGADPFVLYKNLQAALYKMIVESVHSGKVVSNLLYIWQILLKQTENMKNAAFPEHVLKAAVVVLAHTASFQQLENLMIKDTDSDLVSENAPVENNEGGRFAHMPQDDTKQLISNILGKFPGAVATEIE